MILTRRYAVVFAMLEPVTTSEGKGMPATGIFFPLSRY